MDVRPLEAARARRHDLHRATEATANLSPLVPPHHCATIFLVFLHRIHRFRPVVRRNELLCSFDHVQLLRSESDAIPSAEVDIDGHHRPPVSADGNRLRDKHLRVPVP